MSTRSSTKSSNRSPPRLAPETIQTILGKAGMSNVVLSKAHRGTYLHSIAMSARSPGAKKRLFIKAAQQGKLDYVKQLIMLGGVDPAVDDNLAIREAAENGHLNVVRYLASLPGVNPGDVDDDAIEMASMNGHLDVVKFLAGLDSVNPAMDNNSPFYWSAKKGHLDVAKFLYSLPAVRNKIKKATLKKTIINVVEKEFYDVATFLISVAKTL